ncbi:MAG: DNA polymerase Y family protein, partial [Spirochaetia bacterium]
GRITAVNRAAQRADVQPGMRYASALSVCAQLRAGVVQPEEREELKAQLIEVLRQFTPEVEPSTADGALFWVNASGLDKLYPTPAKWAGTLQTAVQRQDLVCSVAVGYSRFGTYAAAKSKRAVTVFESEDQELAAAGRAPVGVLPLDHDVLLRFHQLGILTVRDFNRFSSGALRRRFGREVERLQLFARGEEALPVQPVAEHPRMRREMRLLYPEGSAEALLHHLHMLTEELISQAWSQQELIAEIVISLCPEYWPGSMDECIEESLRSARPTHDQKLWDKLLKLRFEQIKLPGPIIRLSVEARTVETTREQSDLFSGNPKRDPRKALAAIADITAELGNDAVQIAELHNDHLPHAQFSWRRVNRLTPPRPRAATNGGSLIRRILHKPTRLSAIPDEHNTPRLKGPYVLSGGWWGESYRREYYYLEDRSGRLLWLYYDVPESKWMLQGVVE